MSAMRSRIVLTLVLLVAVAVMPSGCYSAGEGSSGEVGVTTSPPVERGMEEPDTYYGTESDVAKAPVTPGAGDDASKVPPEDRLVIRTAGIRIRVDDVRAAVDRVRDLTSSAGGTITLLQVSTNDQPVYDYESPLSDGEPLSGYITVRVPAERIEEFTSQVEDIGTVLQQSAEESDVTQQHIDLNARLDNLQAHEARLREFFDAAEKVDEMLAIEQELARVRAEIESLQAQIAYLERQAAMATLTIQLVRPEPLIDPDDESDGFREAIRDGLRAAGELVKYGLTILIATSPIWLAAAALVGLIFGVRAIRRRRTRGGEVREEDRAE